MSCFTNSKIPMHTLRQAHFISDPQYRGRKYADLYKKTRAALVLVFMLSLGLSANDQEQPPRYNVRVDLVSIDVEVLDVQGNIVQGLEQKDFRVKENGVDKEITHFAWLTQRPLSLAIVLDTSAVARDMLVVAKRFISQLIHLLGREDEISLFSFDARDAYLEQDFTRDRLLLVEALSNIDVPSKFKHTVLSELFGRTPRTGLGIDLALRAAQKAPRGKKALLIISNRFRGLGPGTVDHARSSGCALYAVSFPGKRASVITLGGDAISKGQLMRESGGREFVLKGGDVGDVCRSMALSLKNQYSLGYLTSVTENAAARSLEVSVIGRKCRVYARRSYTPSP